MNATQTETVIDFLRESFFTPHANWNNIYDTGRIRVSWTSEGDGIGYWGISAFDGRPGWGCVVWTFDFGIGTPDAVVIATIRSAIESD